MFSHRLEVPLLLCVHVLPSFCDFHSNELTSRDSIAISAFETADSYSRQQDAEPNLVLMPLVTGKNVKGNLPK